MREDQIAGVEPVPMEPGPVAPPRLSADEEQDSADDLSHEEIMRTLDERMARDLATGVVDQADLEQARRDVEQGAE